MMYCAGLYLMAILNYLSCSGGSQIYRIRIPNSTAKVVANVGSTLWLNCSPVFAPHDVSTEVTWFKYGKPLLEVTFRSMDSVFKLGRHVLVLDELLLADAGKYMCMVVSGQRIENRTFNLSVKEPREFPIILGEHTGNISTTFGKTVVFSCEIQSRTITYIEWHFFPSIPVNAKNISTNDSSTTLSTNIVPTKLRLRVVAPSLMDGVSGGRRTILGERRQTHKDLLYIYNVTYEDSGTYVCLAFNKYGKTVKQTTLTVSAEEVKPTCVATHLEDTSKIPMAILIAIPAGLFLLACTVIIRALEKSRQEKKLLKAEKEKEKEKGKGQEKDLITSKSSATDINENRPVAMVTAQIFKPVHVINERIQAVSTDAQRFDSVSTSSASEVEVVITDNKLARHHNLSKQSSLPSSTDAPYTSPTPDLLSSSSCGGVELDWEGMDLTIPEGFELVELSREAEV